MLNAESSYTRVSRSGSAGLPDKLFKHQRGEFTDRFNRVPFLVAHSLGNHPLFMIARLAELAKFLWSRADGSILFQEANVPVHSRWDEVGRKALSVINGIEQIKDSSSLIVLKRIQQDPEYKALMDQSVRELSELTGLDLSSQITWLVGSIFISSPRSVTPYHIDHETNFLLQVHGDKTFYVCDGNDRSVLTEEEIENYYAGDMSAAHYSQESEKKAHVFQLIAGNGVHNPSRGPHWVRNNEDYSVSLSINFCLRKMDLEARVYQFNHHLRRLTPKPTPPSQSALKDRLKMVVLSDIGGRSKAPTNYEKLTGKIRRLDRPFYVAEKLLRRSAGLGRKTRSRAKRVFRIT